MAITRRRRRAPADDADAATTGFATSTLSTARSVLGSRPTMRAGTRVPSCEDRVEPAPAPVGGGGDDVVVGQHVAVASDDDPGARAGLLADADLQRHDGGHGARGDVGHRSRRPLLALRDRGHRGAGLGEPRRASAVNRPTSPPAAPMSSASDPEAASARGCTRPPNRTSRRLSRAPCTARRRCRGAAHRRGGPRPAVLAGLRHGSSAPDQSAGSSGGASGPAFGGRCSVAPSAVGRPKASASAAGRWGGQRGSVGQRRAAPRPEKAPDTPSGRPNAAADSASTAGRSSGRGPSRGAVPFDPASDTGAAARGTSAPAGRAQGSPSDSVIVPSLPQQR